MPYIIKENLDGVNVNYTRTFNSTNWQPLFVPFEMSYEDWKDYADVAYINNVHQWDTDNDGKFDKTVIEYLTLGEGKTVRANVPYVIRAKKEGEVTFSVENATLYAAPSENPYIDCSSTTTTYKFTGIYQPKTDMNVTQSYYLSGGTFYYVNKENTSFVLNPFRFYLDILPRSGAGALEASSKPQKISIMVDGVIEDDATGIDEVSVSAGQDVFYDLQGRRVVNPSNGIYIKNGKKIVRN